MPIPEPYASHLPRLLAAAFAEDLPDLTTPAVFGPEDRVAAILVARAEGILAGIPAFAAAFTFLDSDCQVTGELGDGDAVKPGAVAARVEGRARTVLAAERTALNLAAHLSGVATLTRRFVSAVAGTGCQVLDTRKTTPGMRVLEKHAVRCGGGVNHRMGLFDAAMLKDTHIAAAGSLTKAVSGVRRTWGDAVPLIVECGSMNQVEEALTCGVTRILLDNMDREVLRKAVALTAGRATLEASGGIVLSNARDIAETGVNFISVGALTHSAPALDLSLKVPHGS